MKKDKCLVIENKKFLWWKWKEYYYFHNWEYEHKERRHCTKCGKNEILFEKGFDYNGVEYEDWRQSA